MTIEVARGLRFGVRTLLGAAVEFCKHGGAGRQRTDTVSQDASHNSLLDQLDDQRVQALLHEGRNTPLEQAVQDKLGANNVGPSRNRAR